MNAIVAVDKNYGIGYNGDLLFHIKNDMKFFRKITTNKIVIMGRKTFDSMGGKPLKNRINIVISHDKNNISNASKYNCSRYAYAKRVRLRNDEVILTGIHVRNKNDKNYLENTKLIVVNDFDVAYDISTTFTNNEDDIFIIGGSSVYKYFLPKCKYLYLTKVNKAFENVDTYFPINVEASNKWTYDHTEEVGTTEDGLSFSISRFENISDNPMKMMMNSVDQYNLGELNNESTEVF